jgi:outer membrane scaffolding protein for murein synthesis (MipA/OmpV family)
MSMSLCSRVSSKVVLLVGLFLSTMNTGVCQVQSASNDPLVPLPSIFDFTGGGGWGFAIGASVEGENAYDGSDEYEIGIEPAGAVQYRLDNSIFFWEGNELGVKGLANERLLLQGGARYEAGLEPDDSDDGRLDGIKKRDSHIVGFLEARYALDDNWKNWLGARALVGESDFGFLGVLAAGHRFGSTKDGSGAEVYAFSTFGNGNFINKDFGIPASDAQTSGLAETDLSGGYRSTGIQGIYRHILNDDFQFIASVGGELYSGAIGNSPLAREDFETEVALTALYTF